MHSTGDDWFDDEFKNYNMSETDHQPCIYLDLGSIAPNREVLILYKDLIFF